MPLAQPEAPYVFFDLDAMVCAGGRLDSLIDPLTGGDSRWWFGPSRRIVEYGANEPMMTFDPLTGDTVGLAGHMGWTNDCLHSRDLTQAAWVVNMPQYVTIARDQPGADGAPNTGTRIKHIAPTKNVTGAVNNGSGLVRLTVASHGYSTGDLLHVEDVGGVTGAGGSSGGKFTITVVDANTFDLNGSTFGGTYSSGGFVIPAVTILQTISDATSRPSVFGAMIQLGQLSPKLGTNTGTSGSKRLEMTVDGAAWNNFNTGGFVTSQHMYQLVSFFRDAQANPVVGWRLSQQNTEIVIDFCERQRDRTFICGFAPAGAAPVTIAPSQLLISAAGNLIKKSHSIAAEAYASFSSVGALSITSAQHARVYSYGVDANNQSDCTSIATGSSFQTRYRSGGSSHLTNNYALSTYKRQCWGLAAATSDYRAHVDGTQRGSVSAGATWASEGSGTIEIARNVPVANLIVWPGARAAPAMDDSTFMGARSGWNLRERLGYKVVSWERDFGTTKVGANAITSKAELFHPGKGGFWPRYENVNWSMDYLGGNAELQRYRDSDGIVSPQARYGEMHELTASSLKLWTRADSWYDSAAKGADTIIAALDRGNKAITAVADNGLGLIRITVPAHGLDGPLPQQVMNVSSCPGVPNAVGIWNITVVDVDRFDLATRAVGITGSPAGSPSVFAGSYTGSGTCLRFWNIGFSKTVNIKIGAGKNIFVGAPYQAFANYNFDVSHNTPGTILQYLNDTVEFRTVTNNPSFPSGGVQGELRICPLIFDSAMLETRSGLYQSQYGWWEARMKSPRGIGHWPGWWFIRAGNWPPEVDMWEGFFDTQGEINTRHVGRITGNSGTTIQQYGRTYHNNSPGQEVQQFILGSRNLIDDFSLYQMEWDTSYILMAHDNKEAWGVAYKWWIEKGSQAGQLNVLPYMVFQYALGPPSNPDGIHYAPQDPTQFPQCIELDYVRLYVKEC